MLQKMFHNKRTTMLFVSGLLLLLLVPALLIIRPGSEAKASGGGGGCFGGTPSVIIYPTTSSPGTFINVSGSCYPTNTAVKIFFQTPANGVVTAVTDQGGFFYSQLAIPSTYVQGTRYFVHVNTNTFSVKVLFTFTKPSLSVFGDGYNGSQFTFGSMIIVNGSGFSANETVDLVWKDSVTGTSKPIIAGADSSGSVNTTLTMPSFPNGSQLQLVATGRVSGVTASALVHETPGVFPNPTGGLIGTTVALNGGGFGSHENVKIVFQNAVVAKTFTNAKGAFTTNFVVPSTAKPGFGYNAIVASGQTSGAAANASFAVEPNLSISPNQGPAGTFIVVKGSHFTPSGPVTILLISPFLGGSGGSGGGQTFLAGFNALPNGTFKVTVQIPLGLLPGNNYFIQAIDNQSGGSNQVKFRVL